MSNDEIVAALRYCQITEHSDCWGCPANIGGSGCLDALHKDAADALEAQQKRIKELEAGRRWIPVTERLPEPFESVLALIPSEAPLPTVHESYIADHDEWVCILTVERYKTGEVTHWMPMPEMMKEEA